MLHADRNGFFFVLDRTNGELLLTKPFAKVTWATGYGKDGRPILTDTSEASTEGTLICPASSGATNWYSSSWSPDTTLFYLRSNDWCSTYKKQEDPLVDNRWYGGVAPNQSPAVSYIRALNINTGNRIWEFPLSTYGQGGILSTAGKLVFAGGPQGAFLALDALTGREAWHIGLGQNWQASPMTYAVGGQQYIAIAGSGGIFCIFPSIFRPAKIGKFFRPSSDTVVNISQWWMIAVHTACSKHHHASYDKLSGDRMRIRQALIALAATTSLFAQSSSTYQVTQSYLLGGNGGWDYIVPDPTTHRLYIARENRIMVIDEETRKLIG